MSYSVCFSFNTFFSISCHISCPTMWVSPFPRLSVFSPYTRSTSVCVSFHMFFGVSHHISCPTMWVSPFLRCQFSHHIPGPRVCNFHFSIFSMFLAIFQVMQCFVSFSTFFFSFLAKIQVLHSIFLSISCIPLFLSKFQVLQSMLLILNIFQWFSP